MIFKLLILVAFIPSTSYGFVRTDILTSSYIELEKAVIDSNITQKLDYTDGALNLELVESILSDKKNLIDPRFKITPYFNDSVRFWFSIYTQYDSSQVVIHDKNDLGLVYKVLDFSKLRKSKKINRFTKYKIQNNLALEYTRNLRSSLRKLAKDFHKYKNESNSKEILISIKASGINRPKKVKARRTFFLNLAKSLRTQTGQRDMIYDGVIRAYPYFPFLYKQLDNFKLPKELLAISFLESSFNPKAYSKVAAAGIWQFMPYIGNLFMPRANKYYDYRLNPIISSLAAFHLLKQNYQILKQWDLAVPAYNSGTKHLVKARRKFKKVKNLDLGYILDNYKTKHIGFASKNFYAEFIALVHVLAYKYAIYPLKGIEPILQHFKDPENINIYVNKCRFRPNRFFALLEKKHPLIRDVNTHFLRPKSKYRAGSLVISDTNLTSRKYLKLTDKQLKKVYPKYYYRFAKNHKCK